MLKPPPAPHTPASAEQEHAIVRAWQVNAQPWVTVLRGEGIRSRRLVTDHAVLEAVLQDSPQRVLDIGCGEGWLARALAAAGVQVLGVDAVPSLVACARQAGSGDFRVMDYETLAAGALGGAGYDVAVANFSLLGEHSVNALMRALPDLLAEHGRVVVQTLHPVAACGEQAYQDGWRAGTWAGIEGALGEPAPWYFRTLGSWLALLSDAGLELVSLREPLHPDTGQPASLLLVARQRRR